MSSSLQIGGGTHTDSTLVYLAFHFLRQLLAVVFASGRRLRSCRFLAVSFEVGVYQTASVQHPLFISSVYLRCSSRSSLITLFICFVKFLSSSILGLRCSKTGFRKEYVTCFSEARMLGKLCRGGRSWLTSSRTVMSLSLGMI